LTFKFEDGGSVNSLLFQADSSKGVICFWKGNGGNLERWGLIAPMFLKYNYDVIICKTDYRGHGKSKGNITLENFYSDSQEVYDFLKTRYPENRIFIVGYSLGTSVASHSSVNNTPQKTILIEPKAKVRDKYLKAFFIMLPKINRFPFRTDLDIQRTTTPIVIIAGTKSDLFSDAILLKGLLGNDDEFFEIEGADHRTILGTYELDSIMNHLLIN
jgi:pimeloyl-ACP methyl ester carboxylesterase